MNWSLKFKGFLHRPIATLKAIAVSFLFIGILAAVNPTNPGYIFVSPHPYLLGCAIISALLGLRNAFVLSIVCSLAYLGFLWLHVDSQAVESVISLEHILNALAIIAISLALGSISTRFKAKHTQLLQRLSDSNRIIRDVEKLNEKLTQEKKEAEQRVTSQRHTVARILDYAAYFESSDNEEIAQTVVQMIQDQTNIDNAYVYQLKDNDFHRTAGADTVELLSPTLDGSTLDALVAQATETKQLTKSEDLDASTDISAFPNGVCIPLLNPAHQIIGFILIRQLHFLLYSANTFAILEAIAQWAGMAISRNENQLLNQQQTFRHNITGLFSHSYFKRRLEIEFQMARKYSLPLSLIHCEISEICNLTPIQRQPIVRLFARAIENTTREVDVLTMGPALGHFYIIMKIASPLDLQAYRRDLNKEFQRLSTEMAEIGPLSVKLSRADLSREITTPQQFLESECLWSAES